MRCNDCAKFVSLELGDLEVDVGVDNVDGNGAVTGTVRVVLVCADCSTELKESTLDVDAIVELSHNGACDGSSDLEVEVDFSAMDEFVPPKAKRQKHMYGAEGSISVSCECGAKGSVDWKQTVQSSAMDELS